MIRLLWLPALFLLYTWGIKPLVLILADEFFKSEPLFREELFVQARNTLDGFFALGTLFYLFSGKPLTLLAALGLLSGIYASYVKESLARSRMKSLEAVIDLMGSFYHHLLEGGVLEGVFKKPGSDLVLWHLIRNGRGDFEGLEAFAQEVSQTHLNQLILTLKKTRFYDSEQILDEMAFIHEEAIKAFFESKRMATEKLSEGLMIPMALYLVNLIVLILLPHLEQLL